MTGNGNHTAYKHGDIRFSDKSPGNLVLEKF